MSNDAHADRIQRAKEQALTQPARQGDPELISSWRRSQAALGDPGNIHDVPHVADSVLDQHLLEMLGAPMTRFAEDLDGTGLALLLADARGQILQRWFEDRQAESHLDRVGTVRGAVLAETVVGTNGVGTVAALGKPVQVRGAEHYADFYQDAVCTGSPVFHPITRTLLAVVTLSCDLTPRSDLLKPLVRSFATQLEQHLLSVESPNAREMLNVFLRLERSVSRPVLAFGPQGVMIQNAPASALSAHDVNLLRALSDDTRESGTVVADLSTGSTEIHLTAVGPTNRVVTLHGTVAPRAPRPLRRAHTVSRSPIWLDTVAAFRRLRATDATILIGGEPGVGKTELATEESGENVVTVDAAQSHVLGSREWLAATAERLAGSTDLVIRGIETLDAPTLAGLGALLADPARRARAVLTLACAERDDLDAMELRFGIRGVWVPPLRERTDDIPALWADLEARVSPEVALEPSSETLGILRGHAWPGNVKELRRLITQIVAAGVSGVVHPADLPPALQSSRTLTMIERVELEAIRKALQEAQGNRVRAADILGVSRATIYRKMKTYRLSS